jgi:predicted DCC family thiol-disulfide oxidoreductase YuxK
MKTLYVLHDGECAFCQQCREWLSRQSAFVELRFIPMQSPEVSHRFPGLEKLGLGENLLVVSDEGAVYRGTSAWVMCLWALVEYREWAERLSQPALLPLSRQAFLFLSKQRGRLSKWFIRGGPDDVKKRLGPELYATCALNRENQSRKLRDGNPPGSLLR